jgi:hypothetical protein
MNSDHILHTWYRLNVRLPKYYHLYVSYFEFCLHRYVQCTDKYIVVIVLQVVTCHKL